jgi:hypothetical protein
MYQVSAAYLAKLISIGKKRRRIRGSIGSVNFTENDILENSFSYTDIAVKSADIKLGGVFIGSLKLTFLQSFISHIPRGTWKGRELNITIGLFLGLDENDEEIWEDVPIKPFTISEANHSALGIDVTAYDDMGKLDASIQLSVTSGLPYGIASLACQECGVTLGMTAEEMAALPNGDQILGLYPESDIETWRDLISWLAVTLGGFATINRSGELVFRTWKDGTQPDIEIGVNDRFTGGTWSDFSTNYSAVQLTNMEDGTALYYAVTPDDGLTMDIGANPLMQYGVASAREAQCRAILNALQNLKYVPFSSSSLIDPALDLGDVILYSDGIADDAVCCVMRIDFSFSKGATVKGYGKNPSLNGARSSQDKAIAQAARGSKEQGITYYPFINTQAVSLTTTPQRLYRIAFATADTTTVELWHEVKWLVDTEGGDDVEITYEYYLDGVKFDHEPVDTWSDGYHSMPHPYWLLDVEGGVTHYWEVRASLNRGSASVAIGDIHALLKGQKLVGSVKFDGNLEITEEFTPFIGGMDLVEISESITIATQTPRRISASDSFTPFIGGMDIIGLTDNMSITREKEQFNLVTEDGDNLATEDGDLFIT